MSATNFPSKGRQTNRRYQVICGVNCDLTLHVILSVGPIHFIHLKFENFTVQLTIRVIGEVVTKEAPMITRLQLHSFTLLNNL